MREGFGVLLVVLSLGVLFRAVAILHERDYLGCVILVMTGLSLLRAGAELMRPRRSQQL